MLDTEVRADQRHHERAAWVLDLITNGSLKWRHHGIGALQAYVMEEMRSGSMFGIRGS